MEPERGLRPVYLKALGGFLLVTTDDGELIYISENVQEYLGIVQVEVIGCNLFDLVHPLDHRELQDVTSHRFSSGLNVLSRSHSATCSHRRLFIRMRCHMTTKGHLIATRSSAYRVVHCMVHSLPSLDEGVLCFLLTCHLIPHPLYVDIVLDSHTFVTCHKMDMTFIYCDSCIYRLLGYKPSDLIGRSAYDYCHAQDMEVIVRAYRILFAKGQTVTDPYRFLARYGGYMWLETFASVVTKSTFEEPQIVVCVNHTLGGIEERCLVMSKDQISEKSDDKKDDNMILSMSQSSLLSPETTAAVVLVSGDDDNENEASSMQFATERIVKHFSRCICATAADFCSDASEKFSSLLNVETQIDEVSCLRDAPQPNLHSVPSDNSLYTLLGNMDSDLDQRAPWISMADTVFSVDDNQVITSAVGFSGRDMSEDRVIFTHGNAEIEEDYGTVDTEACSANPATDVSDPQCSYAAGTSSAVDAGCHTTNRHVMRKSQRSGSILMNLLMSGRDADFGYQLQSVSDDLTFEGDETEFWVTKTVWERIPS